MWTGTPAYCKRKYYLTTTKRGGEGYATEVHLLLKLVSHAFLHLSNTVQWLRALFLLSPFAFRHVN